MEKPFQYARWLMEDTQTIIHRDLQFYNDAGLSLDLIVNTLESPSYEMVPFQRRIGKWLGVSQSVNPWHYS